MFESVVVGASESETAGRAVTRAIEVAKASGAALHIVSAHGAYADAPPAMPEEFRYTIGSMSPTDYLLARLQHEAELASVPVTTHPVLGRPSEAIAMVARREHADLIVVGSGAPHGTRHLSRVPKAIMDTAPCAVLVV